MALRKHARFLQAVDVLRTTPDIGYAEIALSDARRASARDMLLGVPITANGLIELCRLGWLDAVKLRNSEAAADAVADLTNAATSMRLRPSM